MFISFGLIILTTVYVLNQILFFMPIQIHPFVILLSNSRISLNFHCLMIFSVGLLSTFTSSIIVSFICLNICNVYFKVFVKYDIHSLSQADFIVYFFQCMDYSFVFVCIPPPPSSSLEFVNFRHYSVATLEYWWPQSILFLFICLVTAWIILEKSISLLDTVKHQMMLFKGHALEHTHTHSKMTADLFLKLFTCPNLVVREINCKLTVFFLMPWDIN